VSRVADKVNDDTQPAVMIWLNYVWNWNWLVGMVCVCVCVCVRACVRARVGGVYSSLTSRPVIDGEDGTMDVQWKLWKVATVVLWIFS